MNGISSKAAGGLNNKYKYNGKELQSGEFSDGSGFEFYDYGARMYDHQIARWGVIDKKNDKFLQMSPYAYVLNRPTVMIDPDGNDVIPIVFPDYQIQTSAGKIPGLGHAGVIIIDNKTGNAKYYEYGRYDKEEKGIVRSYSLGKLKFGKDGLPTQESLTKVLKTVSQKSGHNGTVAGVYIKDDNYEKMKEYADKKEKENKDPYREEYALRNNNCGTFMVETVGQSPYVDNVWMPWFESPTGFLTQYLMNTNYDIVGYNPKTGQSGVIQYRATPHEEEDKKKSDFQWGNDDDRLKTTGEKSHMRLMVENL